MRPLRHWQVSPICSFRISLCWARVSQAIVTSCHCRCRDLYLCAHRLHSTAVPQLQGSQSIQIHGLYKCISRACSLHTRGCTKRQHNAFEQKQCTTCSSFELLNVEQLQEHMKCMICEVGSEFAGCAHMLISDDASCSRPVLFKAYSNRLRELKIKRKLHAGKVRRNQVLCTVKHAYGQMHLACR